MCYNPITKKVIPSTDVVFFESDFRHDLGDELDNGNPADLQLVSTDLPVVQSPQTLVCSDPPIDRILQL